jgi:diaminopimelate decarboxylase
MAGLVSGFSPVDGVLHCDGVAIDAIVADTGTPVHVYSAALIGERYRELDAAFAGHPHRLHYAIKANATLAVVRLMRDLGAAADANSGGEIEVALMAGFSPGDIVFTGVGKTREELDRAVTLGLAAINTESPGEVERIEALAAARGTTARVAIRVNPDIAAGSHPHISTGLVTTKFGVPVDQARRMAADIVRRPRLQLVGLHVHVGSQIAATDPLTRSADVLVTLAAELLESGITLAHLDLGGGLGIGAEPGQKTLSPEAYAAALMPAGRAANLPLVLEPGRWLVGPAGVLVTRVVDLKPQRAGRRFVVTDAGMTDFIRPALYGAWHAIEPVRPRPGKAGLADVVGPVCETTDTLGAGRSLPPVEVGDLLAVRDTGAYGSVMASNYNRRPTAAEVLVEANGWRVIRRRQTVADMLRWDA